MVVDLQGLSSKEYQPCDKGKALVALTVCQQLSKRPFIAEAGCQLLRGLWDAVLCHSWLLQAAVGSWAHSTARAPAPRCCSPAQPWDIFLVPPCLSRAVPRCPSSGRCGRAWTRMCSSRSLTWKLRTLKPFPKTASYVLGPVILRIWSQKFTLPLLVEQVRAAVGSLFLFF